MSDVPLASEVPGLVPIEDADDGVRCDASGCPWLLSLFTLGGAPLATGLYLGLVTGGSVLWVPAVAMLLGVVVLAAAVYVTGATGQPPLRAINRHVNPVLGWAWVLAAAATAVAWCLPQYSMAAGVVRQNFGQQNLGSVDARIAVVAVVLLLTMAAAWFYDSPGRIVKLCVLVLKLVAAALAGCFLAAVCVQWFSGKLDLEQALWGFVPDVTRLWTDFNTLWRPADSLSWLLDEVPPGYRALWSEKVLQWQRDAVIAAAGTAVAVNATFLLPYWMLRRRAGSRAARGPLAKASLPVVFVLFVAVVSCVVMASASKLHPRESDFRSQYDALYAETKVPKFPHGAATGTVADVGTYSGEYIEAGETLLTVQTDQGVVEISHPMGGWVDSVAVDEDDTIEVGQAVVALHEDRFPLVLPEDVAEELERARVKESLHVQYDKLQDEDAHRRPLEPAECVLADLMLPRDAGDFAAVLQPLFGKAAAGPLLAAGVLAIVLVGVTLLTITAGWAVCEMLGLPLQGWAYRLGCLAAAAGVAGPFLCTEQPAFWLAVPASIFSLILLPLAGVTFLLAINCKSLLGDRMPRGVRRVAWNLGLGAAAVATTVFSLLLIWLKTGNASFEHVGNEFGGLMLVGALVVAMLIVHFVLPRKPGNLNQ